MLTNMLGWSVWTLQKQIKNKRTLEQISNAPVMHIYSELSSELRVHLEFWKELRRNLFDLKQPRHTFQKRGKKIN